MLICSLADSQEAGMGTQLPSPGFDELLPPLEPRTHRPSLACCHQTFALQKFRLSFLSWALFPSPRPCRAPGSSRVLMSPHLLCHHLALSASDNKPSTSTTGTRNTATTSTKRAQGPWESFPWEAQPSPADQCMVVIYRNKN